MPSKPIILKFKQIIKAPASAVYRAFASSTALREWFCDAALAEPRPGGRLYMWWISGYYSSGEFIGLAPDKKLSFTWRGKGEPAPTRVTVSLAAKGGQTVVTITHDQLGAGKLWAPIAAEYARGWEAALQNLQSVLETGPDLRIVRRPMLGISGGGDLTPESALKLGVPAKAGLQLDSLVEGMGAQAAGLQKDDVLVKLGDKKITGFSSVGAALQGHRAGDVVPVVFCRGAHKKTIQLTLSARPMPEIPATPVEIAEKVRQLYAETDIELAQVFVGVSEAAAARRPTPESWSAREILAHLILAERGQIDFVSELLVANERWYDGYGDNVPAPIQAMLAVYPTASDLLAQLQRTEAETSALIAALPPEFAQRKGSYWRLGMILPFITLHIHEHLGQIKAALEAARAAAS
jgi:uncharacterized protein YndB with AHSA1/START domain/uncharacterized damage-inducible protein DinB